MNSKIIEEYNLQKVKEIMLYILNKVGDIDYYKLMKMIFCADRNNLLVWAEPITNLSYQAKKHGPVPQTVYQEITRCKKNNNEGLYGGIMTFVDDFIIHAEREANLNYLSKTDIEAIDKAVLYLKDKEWGKIEEELHDDVFKRLFPFRKYSLADIAESGGADETTLERIKMNVQLNKMLA